MLVWPWRSAAQALRKNGRPAKAIAGKAISAWIQWKKVRVPPPMP
jgi:hypothetical protein